MEIAEIYESYNVDSDYAFFDYSQEQVVSVFVFGAGVGFLYSERTGDVTPLPVDIKGFRLIFWYSRLSRGWFHDPDYGGLTGGKIYYVSCQSGRCENFERVSNVGFLSGFRGRFIGRRVGWLGYRHIDLSGTRKCGYVDLTGRHNFEGACAWDG